MSNVSKLRALIGGQVVAAALIGIVARDEPGFPPWALGAAILGFLAAAFLAPMAFLVLASRAKLPPRQAGVAVAVEAAVVFLLFVALLPAVQ